MTTTTEGINLQTVGLILIIVGIVGIVLSLLWMFSWRPHRAAGRDRVIERDPYEPPAPY